MLASLKLPIKFHCAHCNSIYMQSYSTEAFLTYPACPQCQKSGQLQGTIESHDILKHPFTVAKSLVQSTLKQLQK